MKLYQITTTIALLVMTTGAYAAGPSGKYAGRGEGSLDLTISNSNHVKLFTYTKDGCGGRVAAKGKMIGVRIMQVDHEEFGKLCRVTLYFDDHFRAVSAQEDNCTIMHGASCGFSGVLKRVR